MTMLIFFPAFMVIQFHLTPEEKGTMSDMSYIFGLSTAIYIFSFLWIFIFQRLSHSLLAYRMAVHLDDQPSLNKEISLWH